MANIRSVFFISDGTGITAKTLGQALLTQFEGIEFDFHMIPYVNNLEKAENVVKSIEEAFIKTKQPPIVFATFINDAIGNKIQASPCLLIDFMQSFISPLENILEQKSSHTIGKSHSLGNYQNYKNRIDAVDFSLSTDDGHRLSQYGNADLILVGVSRCGKTPTSLYLALQFGIFTANYPLTEEDLQLPILPKALQAHKNKLFGLTIDPERLSAIRNERRPNSEYASINTCKQEVCKVEKLFESETIRYLNSTSLSIEEISTRILSEMGIEKRPLK